MSRMTIKRRNYTKYIPLILFLFVLELAALVTVRAKASPIYDPELATPMPCDQPNDGKGVNSCDLHGHEAEVAGHDHSHHTNDFQPTELLAPLALTTCDGGSADGYPCENVDLLAFMPLSSIGNGQGNDIWGWTDSQTGKEYAIMGRTSGTSFVDISDPENPVYLGNLPTSSLSSTWRDMKVYQDHVYVVADSAGSHGMQVFDLTQLRNVASPPATFSETTVYNNFGSAHNIVINEDTGFAYAVGVSSGTTSCSGGLHMINIQNPANPVFAGCFSDDGYTHDAQCVTYNGPDADHQGSEVCFNSNEDTLTIVDVTNKSAPVQLARIGYAGSRYTHQGWLTEDQQYFLLDDELDEQQNGHNTRTFMWDVSNLDSPSLIGTYTASTPNIDHNMYVKGDYVYQANYRAGLRILDISNIGASSLSEVAYFDIYPANDSANFNGAWSTYPYFDSGVVIVSGIEQGLFILRPNLGGVTPTPTPGPTSTPTNTPTPGPTATPNPGGETVTINPEADAYTISSRPNGNLGGASTLRIDASPETNGYLRFDVAGVSGAVTQATLRVYYQTTSSQGVTVHQVGDNSWGELTINASNAPGLGSAINSSGATSANSYVDVDVTSYVTGNGLISFGLSTSDSNLILASSRESGNAPELVVQFGGGGATATPEATNTPIPPTATPGATNTPVPPTPTTIATNTAVPPTATPGGGGGSTFTFNSVDDAILLSNRSTANYGSASVLGTDDAPDIRSYLKFDVAGLDGSVASATLRVFVSSGSATFDAAQVADNSWAEGSITYSNAPAFGAVINGSGAVSGGSWVEIDVTSYISGDGTFSLALLPSGVGRDLFDSGEAANGPELVVVTGP